MSTYAEITARRKAIRAAQPPKTEWKIDACTRAGCGGAQTDAIILAAVEATGARYDGNGIYTVFSADADRVLGEAVNGLANREHDAIENSAWNRNRLARQARPQPSEMDDDAGCAGGGLG